MTFNPYHGLYSNGDINKIVPAPRPQMLLDALFGPPDGFSRPTRRASMDVDLPPSGSSSSTVSTTSSNSPLDHPHRQLSASTLSHSDFPSNPRSDSSLPRYDSSDVRTPFRRFGSIPDVWSDDQTPSTESFERHRAENMPHVIEASKRLQQIVGMRNEEAFKPPVPPVRPSHGMVAVGRAVDFNPALKHLRDPPVGLGLKFQEGRGGRVRTKWELARLAIEMDKQRRGGNENIQGQQEGKAEKPSLRETLLMHGKQDYGKQVRTQLKSITFHDLTPDMRTGGFKNELLAHFEADGALRTRLVCYEVNVPTLRQRQPANLPNGLMSHPCPLDTERWISFLISTPLVSFKANTTSVSPPNLPANSPSWVIFAAPISNITSHPPSKDNILDRAPNGSEILRQVDRFDYDFSHNGIPAFEFMDKAKVLGPLGEYLNRSIGGPFLHGKEQRSYEPRHDRIHPVETHSASQSESSKASAADKNYDEIRDDLQRWADVENMDGEMRNSWWWNEAKGRFLEDRRAWLRIREAMSRGCCRVVLRVEESPMRGGIPKARTGMAMRPWTVIGGETSGEESES